MATLGTMMQAAGYYTAYQGKWHLSNAYRTPQNPGETSKALQPYGFTEFNDWGDIDGGAWAGLKVDPVIAGQAVRWLRDKAPVVARDQPWFMTVNFVNPHDIMSYDYGSTRSITPPPNLAEAVKVKPPAETPLYSKVWDIDVPDNAGDDLSGAPQAVREYAGLADAMFGPVVDPQDWRLGLNFYVNCIRDVDRSVSLVLDALVASGQADRTVVVFTRRETWSTTRTSTFRWSSCTRTSRAAAAPRRSARRSTWRRPSCTWPGSTRTSCGASSTAWAAIRWCRRWPTALRCATAC
jgi:arylsulfatase